ncbi:MAG: hypothetical protein RLY66_342 [Candidatus Parcubacteria bacterium]|jgi:hypothetical protein
MKRILLTVVLSALCQFTSFSIGLNLLYPTGGEILPVNGRHPIVWTNSSNLFVQIYVDWYDTNDVDLVTNNVIYAGVLPEGTNTFILHEPSRWPTEYKYKIRLDGDTNAIVSTSGFVFMTSNATFTATITNQSQWLPNQTRYVNVSWVGFQSNDTYALVLESPVLGKEGYGFLVTNIAMGAESGTQTFAIPYPYVNTPAYPPFSYDVADGRHLFTVFNKRCDIVTTFGSIDMVTAGLRMYLGPGIKNYILRGDTAECSTVYLDAILATNDVSISSIGVIFTSYSSNWISMRSVLKDGSTPLSTNILGFVPSTNSQYHTQVAFPVNLTVPMGTIKELGLECEVLYDSGLGDFVWNTGEISTNLFGSVSATYIGGATISTKVITSSSDYVNILQVITPRFISSGSGSNSVVFGVFCKPSTTYDVETSTNLVNWSTLFSTNSVGDMMQISIPITNGNHFFRLKQN